jgi:predicted DNA-binding ribbon-helix-helix protein
LAQHYSDSRLDFTRHDRQRERMTAPSIHPPVKRSVTIAGHPTSISLEPMFWDALEAEAARQALPVNALVARIDVARMEADDPPNLTSAIRQWLWIAQASA